MSGYLFYDLTGRHSILFFGEVSYASIYTWKTVREHPD